MPRLIPFPDALGLLPETSWFRTHHDNVFNQDWVLLLEAGATLEALDLEDVPASIPDVTPPDGANPPRPESIALILAQGDLTVAGPIYSKETDGGGSGLVVLGNLSAGNLIVGGQEIYVRGDLTAHELFWGRYNHGAITVEGRARAGLWLVTEQYHVEVAGGITAAAQWNDDIFDEIPPYACHATLSQWFTEAVIDIDANSALNGELANALSAWSAIEAACKGQPVLQPIEPPLSRPPRVASDALTAVNLQTLLSDSPLQKPAYKHELTQFNQKPLWRISLPSENLPALCGFYVYSGNRRYHAKTQQFAPKSGFFGRRFSLFSRLFGRAPKLVHLSEPALAVTFTDDMTENPTWRNLSAHEIERDEILQTAWRQCLAVAAQAEPIWRRLVSAVTLERIQTLLDLPFARDHFKSYDDEREYGRYTLSVRQASEGKPQLSLGWRGSNTRDEDGDRKYCWAHFAIEPTDDGGKQAAINFQEYTSSGKSKVFDSRHYLTRLPDLLSAFQAIEAILLAEQAASESRETDRDAQREAETREARPRAQTLPPGDGFLTVPLLDQDGDTGQPAPTQRFRLATIEEVQDEIDAMQFAGENIDHPGFSETGYFLVMDEDCTLPCLELDITVENVEIAGYLFRGNLTLQSHLIAYDTDYSPFFAVKGNLTVRNAALFGNLFYIGGNLRCECVYGVYNHGNMIVAGTLDSAIVIAKDFSIRAGNLRSQALVHYNDIEAFNTVIDNAGQAHKSLDIIPPTVSVTDIFPADLCDQNMWWGMYFPDEPKLLKQFRLGLSVIDKQRLETLYDELPAALPRLFDWVFSSPRLANGSLTIREGENYDGDHYAFARINDAGERLIGLARDDGYVYQLYLSQAPDGAFNACHWVAAHGDITLPALYSEPITETRSLSPMAAKHAFYRSLDQLGFLRYRHALPADAPIEDANSVQDDLASMEKLNDLVNTAACLQKTLDIGWAHNDAWAIDQALFQLGVLSHEQGQDDVARDYFERRLAHAQTTGDPNLLENAQASLEEWKQRSGRGKA